MTGFKQIPFRSLGAGEAFLVPNETDKHLQIFLKLTGDVMELGIDREDGSRKNAVSLFSGDLCYIDPDVLVIDTEGMFVCTGKQVKTNES